MPLRPSQVETLRLVSEFRDGVVQRTDVAGAQGIRKYTAEKKLRALVASGHLQRKVLRPYGPVYILTQLGREALEGQK